MHILYIVICKTIYMYIYLVFLYAQKKLLSVLPMCRLPPCENSLNSIIATVYMTFTPY